MSLLNIVNTGDIQVLRETVRSYQSALADERSHADRLEQQRNQKTVEANMFATMARTLAEKYNVPKGELKKLRAECRRICENDLNRRGFKQFYENPPNFIVNPE